MTITRTITSTNSRVVAPPRQPNIGAHRPAANPLDMAPRMARDWRPNQSRPRRSTVKFSRIVPALCAFVLTGVAFAQTNAAPPVAAKPDSAALAKQILEKLDKVQGVLGRPCHRRGRRDHRNPCQFRPCRCAQLWLAPQGRRRRHTARHRHRLQRVVRLPPPPEVLFHGQGRHSRSEAAAHEAPDRHQPPSSARPQIACHHRWRPVRG